MVQSKLTVPLPFVPHLFPVCSRFPVCKLSVCSNTSRNLVASTPPHGLERRRRSSATYQLALTKRRRSGDEVAKRLVVAVNDLEGGDADLASFEELLKLHRQPTRVFVFSDMNFNEAASGREETDFERARQLYAAQRAKRDELEPKLTSTTRSSANV